MRVTAEALHRLLYGECAVLVMACVALPYLFGKPPRTGRNVLGAITFLLWLLGGFAFLTPR